MKNKIIRPLNNNVVVKLIDEEEETESGIIIGGKQYGKYKRGVIVELPPVIQSYPLGLSDIKIGSNVLFPEDRMELADIEESEYIVDLQSIAAIVDEKIETANEEKADYHFFSLPSWEDYCESTEEYKNWEEWENILQFIFSIKFLEPFEKLNVLARQAYEFCIAEVSPHIEDNFDAFELELKESPDNSLQDKSAFAIKCNDDFFDGNMIISSEKRFIDFTKINTDLGTLVETLPYWMRAYYRLISSPIFLDIAGHDFSRIVLASVIIKQRIHLIGSQDRKTRFEEYNRNSQLMGNFIRFGAVDQDEISPTLATLGINEPISDSVGRVEFKFSFDRNIGDREKAYKIWFDASAPTNENASIIEVLWEIQDINPTQLLEQSYGNILTLFFRNVVLKEFYRSWFKNIRCTTDK